MMKVMRSRWVVAVFVLGVLAAVFWRDISAAFATGPFAWADLPGHVSYTLIALSYWLTDIYWLRVTAVIGLFFEILYFRFSGGNMHTGIGWDVVFILINLYQIYRLVAERRMLSRVHDLHLLKQGVFAGLDDGQLARLIPAGKWKNYEAGAVLAREGTQVGELALICEGEAEVEVQAQSVARIAGGSFVGEMAFATGHAASATVTAARPVRAFVFGMDELREAVASDESVASALHTVVGRDLAAKLRSGNQSALG
jgi:hypothetical protein